MLLLLIAFIVFGLYILTLGHEQQKQKYNNRYK